jgi:hypothetical protein
MPPDSLAAAPACAQAASTPRQAQYDSININWSPPQDWASQRTAASHGRIKGDTSKDSKPLAAELRQRNPPHVDTETHAAQAVMDSMAHVPDQYRVSHTSSSDTPPIRQRASAPAAHSVTSPSSYR